MPPFKTPKWLGNAMPGAVVRVEREGETLETVAFSVERGYVLVGRDKHECDVRINNESVARTHAAVAFHQSNQRPYLIDLGAESGTKVDGERVAPFKPVRLHNGTRVDVGASTRHLVVHVPSGDGGDEEEIDGGFGGFGGRLEEET